MPPFSFFYHFHIVLLAIFIIGIGTGIQSAVAWKCDHMVKMQTRGACKGGNDCIEVKCRDSSPDFHLYAKGCHKCEYIYEQNSFIGISKEEFDAHGCGCETIDMSICNKFGSYTDLNIRARQCPAKSDNGKCYKLECPTTNNPYGIVKSGYCGSCDNHYNETVATKDEFEREYNCKCVDYAGSDGDGGSSAADGRGGGEGSPSINDGGSFVAISKWGIVFGAAALIFALQLKF